MNTNGNENMEEAARPIMRRIHIADRKAMRPIIIQPRYYKRPVGAPTDWWSIWLV